MVANDALQDCVVAKRASRARWPERSWRHPADCAHDCARGEPTSANEHQAVPDLQGCLERQRTGPNWAQNRHNGRYTRCPRSPQVIYSKVPREGLEPSRA